MIFQSPSTIRSQLTRLVAASVFPVWLLSGVLIFHAYSAKRDELNAGMLSTARSLTMLVDRDLTNVEAALWGLSTSPSFATGDLGSVHRQALQLLKSYPGADIIVADESGQQLVNTFRPYGAILPKRKNPETVRRVFATGKLVVSDLFFGALTNRPLIGIDVPVSVEGKVKYDLSMTFPADSMKPFWLKGLPEGQYATILDSKQVVVARSRDGQKYLGKRASAALCLAVAGALEGTIEATNLEEKPVFVSFSRSLTSGWTVTVGVAKAIVFAELFKWMGWAATWAAVISIIGVAFAAFYARRIARAIQSLVDPAVSIGRGELIDTADHSIKEIKEVAIALVRASNLIVAGSKAQHKTEMELIKLNEVLRQEVLERKGAQEALSSLLHEQTIILENAPIGISKMVDRKQVWINKKTEELFLYSKDEAEGQTTRKLYPSDEAYEKLGQEAYPALAQGGVFETVQTLKTKDGRKVLIRYIGKAIDPTDMRKGTLWLLEDITERVMAEKTLKKYAQRLIELEENLRKRVSMELHDNIGQELTALGLNLAYICNQLQRETGRDLSSVLNDSRQLTKEISRTVRDLMVDLRPSQLEDYGLAGAISSYVDQYAQRTGLSVAVQIDPQTARLSPKEELSLFRITQEALNNVAKYAAARKVTICLDSFDSMIRLSINDDGEGFVPKEAILHPAGSGWGLTIMRERAELSGGSFRLDTHPGKGTSIVIEVPKGSQQVGNRPQ